MLCQLSEALFNMWLRGFDTENDRARDLTPATKRAFKKAYGIEITDVDYVGLATHSPLKERTVGKSMAQCREVATRRLCRIMLRPAVG
jgi:hypothetical protein